MRALVATKGLSALSALLAVVTAVSLGIILIAQSSASAVPVGSTIDRGMDPDEYMEVREIVLGKSEGLCNVYVAVVDEQDSSIVLSGATLRADWSTGESFSETRNGLGELVSGPEKEHIKYSVASKPALSKTKFRFGCIGKVSITVDEPLPAGYVLVDKKTKSVSFENEEDRHSTSVIFFARKPTAEEAGSFEGHSDSTEQTEHLTMPDEGLDNSRSEEQPPNNNGTKAGESADDIQNKGPVSTTPPAIPSVGLPLPAQAGTAPEAEPTTPVEQPATTVEQPATTVPATTSTEVPATPEAGLPLPQQPESTSRTEPTETVDSSTTEPSATAAAGAGEPLAPEIVPPSSESERVTSDCRVATTCEVIAAEG
jgi:hypothetical protein